MRPGKKDWLVALPLALAAHIALAYGLGAPERAMIERGGGEAGAIVVGSLADSVAGLVEAETPEAAETADEPVEAEAVAEATPVQHAPQPVPPELAMAAPDDPASPASEPVVATVPPSAPMDDSDVRDTPVQDAVMPPITEVELKKAKPLDETPPVAAAQPVPAPLAEPMPIPKVGLEPVQPAVKKAVKRPKPERRLARGGKTDSRKGASGGAAGTGGGGHRAGLGGREMMSNYRGRVMAHLRRYKRYPASARSKRLSGTVRMRFTLGANGRVISARLAGSSGSSLLDKSARQTLRRASPFPSFPRGMGRKSMTFLVPIRYRM